MPGREAPQRPGAPLRPRRALVVLGALGCGALLGRVLDVLDFTQPFIYGTAAWLSACGLTRAETEADPIG